MSTDVDENEMTHTFTRGIGAAIATLLGARGANVVVNYTSPSSKAAADKVAKAIDDNGTDARAVVVHANVVEKKGQEALVNAALELSLTKHINILVHNAAAPGDQLLQDITEETYHKQMDLNVKSMYHQCHATEKWRMNPLADVI